MFILASTGATQLHSYNVPWFMYVAVIAALALYTVLEIKHTRQDHEVKLKEAIHWSVFYIALALAFSIPVFLFISPQAGGEYIAAWAVEKALSLDNLFVIGLIFTTYRVKPELERRMLNYGIAGAIVFRLLFILAGFELLRRFEWVSIIFGIILLRAAWKSLEEARHQHDSQEEQLEVADGKMWRFLTRILAIHRKFDGHKLTTVVNDKRMLTMMAAVIILIELTDVIFAVDSIPAVLAVSPDRFIAYSSNVFALLGLRALFFVYQAGASKFWALNWALALILAWISFKLIAAPFGLHVPVAISLGVLAFLFASSVVVSLVWQKHTTN